MRERGPPAGDRHRSLTRQIHPGTLTGSHGTEPVTCRRARRRSASPRGCACGLRETPALLRDARADAPPRARHGLRGGGVPESARVLVAAPRHRDGARQRVHARVRVLQRGDRPARPRRPGRARAARRGGGRARPAPRGDHLGRPRRPRRRRRRSTSCAASSTIRRARAAHHDRDPHARLPPQAGRDRARRGRAARRLQPQRRDGAAPLPADPARRELRALARPAARA